MTPSERKYFDRLLERVIPELPQQVLELMDEVPLIVEDYPSEELCRELELSETDELCGVYHGISKIEPELEPGRRHSDQILLFREGIASAAANDDGIITDTELMQQMRITILHEYGHHFGLDEEDLRELGYG
jgi:predicted Zn-dependent protease with MMP-like domain